jgi:hypothetical protein
MDFEEALFNQLQAMPIRSIRLERLYSYLRNPPTPESQAIVAALEPMVLAKMNLPPTETLDWATLPGTIDWATIIALIEQYLPTLYSIIEAFISAFTGGT